MSDITKSDQAIREAVRRAMREQGITHAALAERLGVKQPSVADLISGRRGKQPESLVNLLDALGLELVVKPKTQQPPKEQAPAYLSLVGMFDDPDSPGDVSTRHDDYLGELEEEHERSTSSHP